MLYVALEVLVLAAVAVASTMSLLSLATMYEKKAAKV